MRTVVFLAIGGLFIAAANAAPKTESAPRTGGSKSHPGMTRAQSYESCFTRHRRQGEEPKLAGGKCRLPKPIHIK